MNIVQANKNDLSEILALQKAAFTKEAEEFSDFNIDPMTQTLEALEEQFEKYLFLKISDSTGSIIGSTRGYVEGETSYIGRTFVRLDYQGQGIGTELIKELENRNPAYRYEINSSIRCPQYIKLYEHLGYVRFKEVAKGNNGFVYLEKIKRLGGKVEE